VATLSGMLDLTLLAPVPGGQLRKDAAASWLRLREAAGVAFVPTSTVDTYRPYATQERIFLDRYVPWFTYYNPLLGLVDRRVWNGVPYWRKAGSAAAAVPGTSNHGWGLAIDVTGLGGFAGSNYKTLAKFAPAHGWDNVNGRRVDEAWHWEYVPANDRHTAAPVPTPKPLPTDEPDDTGDDDMRWITAPDRPPALITATAAFGYDNAPIAAIVSRDIPVTAYGASWEWDTVVREANARGDVLRAMQTEHTLAALPAGAALDYAALAKAVNDDAARRLAT
jgi:hypothetical protein